MDILHLIIMAIVNSVLWADGYLLESLFLILLGIHTQKWSITGLFSYLTKDLVILIEE